MKPTIFKRRIHNLLLPLHLLVELARPLTLRVTAAFYHGPCLRPNHQIAPTVTVFWSLLNTFC
jgi:hypothetical protein